MSTQALMSQDPSAPTHTFMDQQKLGSTDGQGIHEYDPFRPEGENFQDALVAIADDQPLNPGGTIQETAAKLNPIPAIQQQSTIITEHSTAGSHDLARAPEIEGALQAHDAQINGHVRDIGWHKANAEIPDPLIGGLSNGQLFAMIRRFNKV